MHRFATHHLRSDPSCCMLNPGFPVVLHLKIFTLFTKKMCSLHTTILYFWFLDTFLKKVSKNRRFAIVRTMLSAPCFAPSGAFASAQEVQNDQRIRFLLSVIRIDFSPILNKRFPKESIPKLFVIHYSLFTKTGLKPVRLSDCR